MLEAEGNRTLEVGIFEAGVPPEWRLYPLINGEPADLRSVQLSGEIHRLGGVVDQVEFAPTGAFLRGNKVVYEPHSFSVVLTGTWEGEPVSWSWDSIEGRVEMSQDLARASGVEEGIASPATVRASLELPGEIQLNQDRLARVAPRLSGTVVQVHAGLGDQVRAGQVLAIIESRELAVAQRDYIESLHKLELAQSTYERERRLHERGISARKDYEMARHELEEAELEKQVTEQELGALGVPPTQLAALGVEPEGLAGDREVRAPLPTSLTRYAVRAPISGEVIARNLAVGQTVEGSEEAFLVADLRTVWVEVTVYARDLAAVRVGQQVIVRARDAADQVGSGPVRYVGPLLGENTRTARALVTLPNNGEWRPGMYVSAEVVQGQEEVAIAVRREAIQTWRDMPVVFARFGDVFEVRPLTLGRADAEHFEVLDGLEPGQPYAAAGAYVLKADLEKSGASHDH